MPPIGLMSALEQSYFVKYPVRLSKRSRLMGVKSDFMRKNNMNLSGALSGVTLTSGNICSNRKQHCGRNAGCDHGGVNLFQVLMSQ